MLLLAKVGTGLVGGALLVCGIVSSEGFLHVRVEQKQANGTHLHLLLPAAAVPMALDFVPRRHLREATVQVQPWLPAIEAVASGLADTPDGPLVEVSEPGRRVSVVKTGGSLVVDVDDPRETVHVSVPLRAMRSAAGVIADRTRPD